MDNLKKILDLFFQSENRVIVIKGDWGVGKTFFWENYYHSHKKQLNKIAYSYISLFGKNSINDIKKEIFHYATPIDLGKYKKVMDGQDEDINGKFLPRTKAFYKYNRGSKFIIKYFNNTTFGFKASSLITALEYGFVKDYVICFDDLERKGTSLEIKEFMGLVDELARKKNCKIVLIFNEKNLKDDSQEKQFSEYREKIVDIELMYNPSVSDNLNKIFFKTDYNLQRIERVAQDLNIINLRIISKIKHFLNTYEVYLKNAVENVRQDFVNRVSLFSLIYYSGVEHVQYEDFKKELSGDFFSFLDEEEIEKSPARKFLGKIGAIYDSRGDSFDNDIDFYLRNGYVNPASEINKIIHSQNDEYSNIELNEKINKVWSIYTNSFKVNDDIFISEVKLLLSDKIHLIPLRWLGNLMNMLDNLGVDCESYIDEYVSETLEIDYSSEIKLKENARFDMPSGFEKLDRAISEKIKSLHDKSSIEEILIRLSGGESYKKNDIIALNSFTEDDYYHWIINGEKDVMNLTKNGLLRFDNLINPSIEQQQITKKAKSALRKISNSSILNGLRVKSVMNEI